MKSHLKCKQGKGKVMHLIHCMRQNMSTNNYVFFTNQYMWQWNCWIPVDNDKLFWFHNEEVCSFSPFLLLHWVEFYHIISVGSRGRLKIKKKKVSFVTQESDQHQTPLSLMQKMVLISAGRAKIFPLRVVSTGICNTGSKKNIVDFVLGIFSSCFCPRTLHSGTNWVYFMYWIR